MGVSVITALELFTNPYDLDFFIYEEDKKWAIIIKRGPGHGFKFLISCGAMIGSKVSAITGIANTIRGIREECGRIISDPATLAGGMLNPDGRLLEEACVLTEVMQERIIRELEEKNFSHTYEWSLAPA